MYPVLRLLTEMAIARRQPPLPVTGTHVSQHRCWPWDIDLWMELNNGRTLTLYDLGRLPLAARTGLLNTLKRNRWGLTVAGSAIRYRRRIRPLARFTMRSSALGWDDKFLYVEQSMWQGEACCGQVVLRLAVTRKAGIVPPPDVVAAHMPDPPTLELPEWVQAWSAAEALRPWPPERPD